MALFDGNPQNPLGPNPGVAVKIRVMARGGDVKVGTIGQFTVDAADDGAVSASLSYGGATNPMSNTIASIATEGLSSQALWTLYCVYAEDITEEAEGWAYLKGDILLAWDAQGDATGSGGTAGSAAGLISLVSNDHERVIAIARETTILYVSGSAVTRTRCYFDGINGFGQFSA